MAEKKQQQKPTSKTETRPKYQPPKVVTYKEDDILKRMGPVGGCVSPDYDPLAFDPERRESETLVV